MPNRAFHIKIGSIIYLMQYRDEEVAMPDFLEFQWCFSLS